MGAGTGTETGTGYPATPELDKALAVKNQSQTIGEFLEWLGDGQGVTLCVWRDAGDNGEPRTREVPLPDSLSPYSFAAIAYLDTKYGEGTWKVVYRDEGKVLVYANPDYESWGDGWVPVHRTTTAWLALYFGLNEQVMAREQEAILAWVRERNAHG